MAGGASTPELVVAAARAGGAGFLAGGYKTAESLADQVGAVRRAGVPFGVNVFAPNPVPVDRREYRRYAEAVGDLASELGVELDVSHPTEDDDAWDDKIDLLLSDPVPMVSFTFGIPDRKVVSALRRAGSRVAQTVTSAEEACRAATAGADVLVVQGSEAGGHSATLTPRRPARPERLADLVGRLRSLGLPIIAAGGLATPGAVAEVVRAGARAAMVGTVLLRTEESGASAVHREALASPRFTETTVTRAFTGRPARALRNGFIDRFDRGAPHGYPALHHLTSPLRKAAAAEGEAEAVHLWAGTGYREARAESAERTLRRLGSGLRGGGQRT